MTVPVLWPVWFAVAIIELFFPRPKTKSRGQPWPETSYSEKLDQRRKVLTPDQIKEFRKEWESRYSRQNIF